MTAVAFIPANNAALLPSRAASSFTPAASPVHDHHAHPSPLPRPSRPSAPPPPPAFSGPVASNDFFRSVAEEIHRKQAKADKAAGRPPPATDLHTVSTPKDFPLSLRATVVSVTPLTTHNDYVQLTVDVSDAAPHATHTRPGQSMHLARVPSRTARQPPVVQAIIASPPDTGPHLDFLLSRAADPARLTSLRPGDQVAVGPVSGPAFAVDSHLEARANLLVFVDSPQGYAAARSLVEWPTFRAMSGAGANRTSAVTIFYALPSHRSIPYADRFSKWSVFGVNVVPIAATSLLDYVSAGPSLFGIDRHAIQSSAAIIVSRDNAEYEKLNVQLLRLGMRRGVVDRLSADDVAAGGFETARRMPKPAGQYQGDQQQKQYPRQQPQPQRAAAYQQAHFHRLGSMPQDAYEEMLRSELEREIWAEWVALREAMRKDLQQELEMRRRRHKSGNQAAEVERVAWEGWNMRNRDAWSTAKWDDDAWNTYWKSWGAPGKDSDASEYARSSEKTWNAGGYDSTHRGGSKWNQTESQEYWDWAGGGVGGGGGSRSSRSKGGPRQSAGSSYSEQYSGYNSWGNANNQNSWSGYQKGGYKYQYEETAEDRKERQQGYGGSGAGGGGWRDWKSWAGWGSQNSQRNRTGSNQWSGAGARGGGGYGRASRQGDNLDLYGILGINSSASRAEIKKAYRKKAMDHHPDRNPERLGEAEVMMKKIVVAWTVLKDDGRRRTYDQTGVAGM